MNDQDSQRPWTERDRLLALHRAGLLDTPPEQAFDDLVRLAADIAGVPMAAVHLVAEERQWGKAEIGLGARNLPREASFCPTAMLEPEGMVVPDATRDPRFADSPLVTGGPGIRFYAGMPVMAEGLPIGALCVIDTQPRAGLSERQRFALKTLAAQVGSQIALRRALVERDQASTLRQQTLDSATDFAIVSSDLTGRVTGWNRGAEAVTGWTGVEMLGQAMDRFFTPEDRASGVADKEMRTALRDGRASDERWHMRADGTRFWASGEMMPLLDNRQQRVGYLKVLRDRTDQHRAGDALAAMNERYRIAQRATRDAIWDWNLLSNHVLWNEALQDAYGWMPEQMDPTGNWWIAQIHPGDRVRIEVGIHAVIDGAGTEWTDEYRFRRADGSYAAVLDRGFVIRDGEGRPIRMLGAMFDLSERKAAEQAVQAREAQLEAIFAEAAVGLSEIGLDGRFLRANIEMCRILGRTRDELVGQSVEDVTGRPFVAPSAAALSSTVSTGKPAILKKQYRRPDGSLIWAGSTLTRLTDEHGEARAVLAVTADLTATHVAEKSMRASEARLSALVWASSDAVYRMTPDWHTMRQLKADGFLADTDGDNPNWLQEYIHPDDQPLVSQAIEQAIRTRTPFDLEHRVRTVDGQLGWTHSRAVPVLDEAGRVTEWFGMAVDVTRRRLAQQHQDAVLELADRLRDLREPAAMLRASSEALGRTLGASRAGYGTVDAATETVAIDRDWCAEATVSSITGLHAFREFGSFIDGLRRGEVTAIADVNEDTTTRESAGQFAAIQIRALLNVPLMDGGRLVAIVLAHQTQPYTWSVEEVAFARAVADRTWAALQQARAEAALREMNDKLEQQVAKRTAERDRLWKISSDLFVVCNADGLYRAGNPAWQTVLGYGPQELVGTRHDVLAHPDDRAVMEQSLRQLRAGKPVRDLNVRLRHRDGSYRTLNWTCIPEGGELYATGRDVTEQRAVEEQLRQAQKMEAVGQLTGGLAHDFNNMLTGITGSLELLGTRVAQGRYKDVERYVAAGQGAAKRAAALTHRLLAFSRRQTLDPKAIDVNRLVLGMEDLIRRTVGPAVELGVVGAGGLWPTLVDPPQLENALLNLCINARDAMPGGGRLTVETANRWIDERAARTHELSPGQYVSLCVSDTGTGMSREVVAKAFDPFFTTKPLGQGTGLGLSMIYGFAQQSGGQARIYSEVGQGTMVCLYLPRYLGEAELSDAMPDPVDAPRASRGETVLVVDDEPTVRMLVTEVLEELGYAAIEAADGAAGLRVLQSDARIDLLVSDVGLPGGMNGRQMADAARVSRPDLKVLFITGYAENAVVGDGHLEPGMHVMTKPFAMEALASRIRELIAAP